MISKIFNFVSTILVSAILITIYDRLVQPVVMVMSEEHRRGLRGNENNDNNSVSESKALPNPSFAIVEEVTRTKASSCSKFNENENSCNSNSDEHGNACRYCVDHESINRVCVSDVSIEYRFAPCNNWICHVSDEPEKSDVTACERI